MKQVEPFLSLINLDKPMVKEIINETKSLQTASELIGPSLIKSLVKRKSDIS
jgi:hypothetical protein